MARQTIDRYVYRYPALTMQATGIDPSDVPNHENAYPWSGVLSRVDEPSAKPPGGAEGHHVILPREVVRHRLNDLTGMPLNVDPVSGYRDHAKGHPIGVILGAEIKGKDLWVHGLLYKKYWPDEVATIQNHKPVLGLSYEIGSCDIEDTSAKVWKLKDFRFTGASCLLKTSAAYGSKTSIAAAATRPDCWTPIMRQLRQQGRRLAGLA